MGWVLTKGIEHLRGQVNAAFPDRDRKSDGTVGDLAHQTGSSGHNPDLTGKAEYRDGDRLDEVRAWDMDADLRMPGVTTQEFVDHIRGLPKLSTVLRYIIFNRKIYKASNGWKPETYDGPSPHTEHVHFSGAYSQAADSNTTFDYRLEELVALTTDDINKVAAAVAKAVWATEWTNPANGKKTSAAGFQCYNDVVNANSANDGADKVITSLTPLITAGKVNVDELVAKLVGPLTTSVIASLPADRDDVTPAELQDAIVGALKILVDRPAS